MRHAICCTITIEIDTVYSSIFIHSRKSSDDKIIIQRSMNVIMLKYEMSLLHYGQIKFENGKEISPKMCGEQITICIRSSVCTS